MTISSVTRVAGPYAGTGTQQIFPFSFKVFANTDLLVILTDPSGNNTTQILTSQYSVSLDADQNANPGGTVTMLTAPGISYLLTLSSQVPDLQPTNLANVGNFYPTALTDALDRATIQIQQLAVGVGNALQIPITSTGISTTLPNPAANQLLGWNPTATALVNINPTGTATTTAANVIYTGVDNQPIYRVQDLSSNTAAAKGDALVGHINLDGTPSTVQGALWSFSRCESILALLAVPAVSVRTVEVLSYNTGWAALASFNPFGGGMFTFDPTALKSTHDGGAIISPTVPWDGSQANLAAFLAGTGETTPAGSGCWVRIGGQSSVLEYGARADNTSNDLSSFQKALDSRHRVKVPNGTYSLTGTLSFNFDGCCLLGDNMNGTTLNFQGAGPVIQNPLKATVTRLFCEIRDLKIVAAAAGANNVVDWGSFQFGVLDRVWILGQPIVGCTLLSMTAAWNVTQCTYNEVTRCYMGNMLYGIVLGDGANNNNIRGNRIQPGGVLAGGGQLAGAIGVLLSATVAERISSVNVIENGFEYPGAISTGVNILQNCTGIRVTGNRFEAQANGIVVGATANRDIYAPHDMNYFSGCTIDISLSTGGTGTTFTTIAGGSFASGVANGNVNNLALSVPSTGVYQFTFTGVRTTMPDNAYTVLANSSAPITTVTAQSTTGFTISTFNAAGPAVTAALVNCQVLYNK